MVLNSQLVTFWVILLFFFGPCTAVESLLLQRLLSRELKQKCSTIGKCEMCKSNDHRTDEACKPTGRRQKFICPSTDSGANDGKKVYGYCIINTWSTYQVSILWNANSNIMVLHQAGKKLRRSTEAVKERTQMTSFQWYVTRHKWFRILATIEWNSVFSSRFRRW